MTEKTIHIFENAGMGKAPFRVVGLYSIPSPSLAEHNPSAYNAQLQAMPKNVACGSCYYCHAALVHNFIIESSDKKLSVVGCDCVAKVNDSGLVKQVKLLQKQQRDELRRKQMEEKHLNEIEKQRKANGGLTNEEVLLKKKNEAIARREPLEGEIVEMLTPFIKALGNANGEFCDSMRRALQNCNLELSNNCLRLIIEISAKEAGRKGSKKYEQRYDELEPIMLKALEKYKELPDVD